LFWFTDKSGHVPRQHNNPGFETKSTTQTQEIVLCELIYKSSKSNDHTMANRTQYQRLLLLSLTYFIVVHARYNFIDLSSKIRTIPISEEHNIPNDGSSSDIGIDSLSVREDMRSDLILPNVITSLRGGGYIFPAGWNPMGYKITARGEQFLALGDSLLCDVGRLLASLKSNRKSRATIKDSWLEIVRVSKTGQAMRIYRTIDELIDFCLKTGLID
jgi:hypothetical protein